MFQISFAETLIIGLACFWFISPKEASKIIKFVRKVKNQIQEDLNLVNHQKNKIDDLLTPCNVQSTKRKKRKNSLKKKKIPYLNKNSKNFD